VKKPIIPSQQALLDIRTGMDESALMKKYGISAKGLQSLFSKLTAAGLITKAEIDEFRTVGKTSVELDLADYTPFPKLQGIPAAPAPKGGKDNKPSVAAAQAVEDIKAGMDDAALMKKYGVSVKGLQSLFRKLIASGMIKASEIDFRAAHGDASVILEIPDFLSAPAKPQPAPTPAPTPEKSRLQRKSLVDPREAVADIRIGMADQSLMKKYAISAKGLQSLFRKLVASGLISRAEIDSRGAPGESSVILEVPKLPLEPLGKPLRPSSERKQRGTIRWEFETETWFSSRPVTDSETVFFGAGNGNLYAVNVETGSLKWRYESEGGLVLHQTVHEGTLFAVTEYGYLHALEAATGAHKWRFKPEIGVIDLPVVVRDAVYVGSLDGTLYAVDVQSGTELWSFKVEGTAISSPTIVRGMVCFGSDSGRLYCVTPQ
jgi:DNA-binding HxlR family transcriptional regulator